MKSLATPALLTLSALAFAFIQGETIPVRAQPAPVQAEQTPRQSDQSREQDRARAEDVRIGRDWKAQEGKNDRAGRAAADKDHENETIDRDWRAHPDVKDR